MYLVKSLEKKKNKYIVSIEFQGKETPYEVSDELILEYRLVTGKILDDLMFKAFMNAFNNDKYRQKLMYYCTYKPRTVAEAIDYLSKFDMPEKAKKQLVNKLELIGILNDDAYVKQYIQEFSQFRLIGPKKIVFDLQRKGIEPALVALHIKGYDHVLMRENIKKWILKKLKSSKNKPMHKLTSSIMSFVVNKGYDYQMVQDVIQQQMQTINLENDEDAALEKDFDNYLRKFRKSNQSQSLKQYCLPKLIQKGYTYHKIMSLLEGETNESK